MCVFELMCMATVTQQVLDVSRPCSMECRGTRTGGRVHSKLHLRRGPRSMAHKCLTGRSPRCVSGSPRSRILARCACAVAQSLYATPSPYQRAQNRMLYAGAQEEAACGCCAWDHESAAQRHGSETGEACW
jgi:hypothetical protein